MAYGDRYKAFEQYLTFEKPRVKERARNWSIAIGLQDVDGLKPSEFLLEQSKANIEGKISSAEVGRRLEDMNLDVIFSNGVDQREITHSSNEFVITIPRKSDQVTNQVDLVTDPAHAKTDPVSDHALGDTDSVQANTDPVSDQVLGNTDPAQVNNNSVSDQVLGKTDPVSDQPTPNTTKLKLSKKQQDIRNFCTVPRNRQEILQRAGITDHFDNRKKYIYDLVEAGVLERTIPNKPNDPNQKYRRKQ